MIALENTHNICGGVALTVEYTRSVGEIAREHGLKFHLDGARIFNAAAALDIEPAELVEPFDSVMFCLSKGLGAPVGSLLCGDAEFIARARRTRKMLGGGMRQAGVIAQAGLFALQHNLPLLKEDHRRAREMAGGLADLPGMRLLDPDPPTNMIYLKLNPDLQYTADDIKEKLKGYGILIGYEDSRLIRLVTHLGIKDEDIPVVVQGFQEVCSV
jgi:threonine aldolase